MALSKLKTKPVRILVVDDELPVLELYKRMLKQKYYIKYNACSSSGEKHIPIFDLTLCTESGQAIKEVQEAKDEPFSLAFLDIHLILGQDGIWTGEQIRVLDSDIEIVLVTGYKQIDLVDIGRRIPPRDKLFYLNKPFSAQEIQQFALSLTAKWQMQKKIKELQTNMEEIIIERTDELLQSNQKLKNEINKRKNVEKSLRQSEEKFRKIINHIADSIMILNKKGIIQFINPATEDLYNTKKAELLGASFPYVLIPGKTSEIQIYSQTEEDKVVEMSVVETEWQEKPAFLASLRDITQRKNLECSLQNSLQKVQTAMKAIIQVIERLLETKDPYTADHQRRVAELAFRIAQELGLDEYNLESIHIAGLIHDIGKISIPSEILIKPGRLSDLEYNLIKTHSQIGYEILKEIEFPWPVAQIVYQHHERLNGSGYPLGLCTEEIQLLSKILSVADVMEAISSHRPYRAALGIKKGLDHILNKRGQLYDPRAVDACISLFKENRFKFKTEALAATQYLGPLHNPATD